MTTSPSPWASYEREAGSWRLATWFTRLTPPKFNMEHLKSMGFPKRNLLFQKGADFSGSMLNFRGVCFRSDVGVAGGVDWIWLSRRLKLPNETQRSLGALKRYFHIAHLRIHYRPAWCVNICIYLDMLYPNDVYVTVLFAQSTWPQCEHLDGTYPTWLSYTGNPKELTNSLGKRLIWSHEQMRQERPDAWTWSWVLAIEIHWAIARLNRTDSPKKS